jgi:hypothetical protein
MKSLPITATDDEIRGIVVDWVELLAAQKFEEALDACPPSHEELGWSAPLLENVISGYGVADAPAEIISGMAKDHGVDGFRISSLIGRPDAEDIIQNQIDVDRRNLYGLDPDRYLGMVHFDDVPLSGFRSDLTARFHIKRIGEDRLFLEFLDIHVM